MNNDNLTASTSTKVVDIKGNLWSIGNAKKIQDIINETSNGSVWEFSQITTVGIGFLFIIIPVKKFIVVFKNKG